MFSTFFLLLLTLSLLVTVGFALYALCHWQTPGARPFAFILLGYGLYTVWYACELLATSLASKIAWDNLQFTATDIIIIGYLWFALEYTRRAAAMRRLLPWFWGILALNALLVWTNPAHHLVRSASALLAQGNVTILTYTYGPWFWIYMAYLVLGVLSAVGVLITSFVRAPRFYQWQVGAVIIGILTPLVSGLMTAGGLMPFPELAHLDVNPLTYLVITPLWGWALFHQRFLDLVPIARSHLVEAMPDGMLVIDAQGRIVDCNASAHGMLPGLHTSCIGTPATTVLPALAAVLIAEPSRTHARPPSAETASGIVQPCLDIRSTPLHDAREHLAGWLVTLRDQTEYWQMEQSLRDQNARLEHEILERQQAEEAYHTLVDNSLQGLVILQDDRTIFANAAAAQITGYSADELLAMSPEEAATVIHPADRSIVVQRGRERQSGAAVTQQYIFRIIRKDGSLRWLEAFAVRVTYQRRTAVQMSYIDITERKQAEEALRKSEARFAAFMNYLPGPAFVHDQHGHVLFANRIYCQHLNRPAEEIIGQPYHTLMLPEWAAYFQAQDHEVLATQQACVFEDRAEIDDQTTIFLTTKFPMQQADGSTHIGGVAVDITERKQAEEALRASEKRLKAVFDNAAIGIGLTDKAGQSIIANARGAQQLGYTPEELEQVSNMELTHPDDLAETVERIQQLVRGEIQGYRIEKRYFRKDGSIFWADLSVSAVYDDDGQIAYLIGIVADITERKQAEEALRESEQFVQQITTAIPDILYIYDLAMQSNVYSNRQMVDVLGYSPEEVQAMGSNVISTLVHPDDLPRVIEHLKLMASRPPLDNTVGTLEYRMRHQDGHWHWLLSREVPFRRTQDGQVEQLLGVAHDITERKQLEERLHQANRLLQEQAIRDPLTGLHNRRYLDETLPRELQRAERRNQPIGIIMLDVDRFKRINDTYGHDAGDTLLRAVGAFLRGNTRGEDVICRYGGEEFTLVLPGAALADTQQRADILCTGIQSLAIEHNGYALDAVTASFGVAVFPDHASTADELIRAADQALYQAKQNGRNQVVIAERAANTSM
jgi:diguanylate cyclase (GGDEF)-like protein/PAS domain S-box-containing protein